MEADNLSTSDGNPQREETRMGTSKSGTPLERMTAFVDECLKEFDKFVEEYRQRYKHPKQAAQTGVLKTKAVAGTAGGVISACAAIASLAAGPAAGAAVKGGGKIVGKIAEEATHYGMDHRNRKQRKFPLKKVCEMLKGYDKTKMQGMLKQAFMRLFINYSIQLTHVTHDLTADTDYDKTMSKVAHDFIVRAFDHFEVTEEITLTENFLVESCMLGTSEGGPFAWFHDKGLPWGTRGRTIKILENGKTVAFMTSEMIEEADILFGNKVLTKEKDQTSRFLYRRSFDHEEMKHFKEKWKEHNVISLEEYLKMAKLKDVTGHFEELEAERQEERKRALIQASDDSQQFEEFVRGYKSSFLDKNLVMKQRLKSLEYDNKTVYMARKFFKARKQTSGDKSEQNRSYEKSYNSLREVFEEGHNCVLIEADAGSGKTSLAAMSAKQWSEKEEQDSENLELWISIFPGDKHVKTKEKNLLGWIEHVTQFGGDVRMNQSILNMIIKDSSRVLFWIDGLDEMGWNRLTEDNAATMKEFVSNPDQLFDFDVFLGCIMTQTFFSGSRVVVTGRPGIIQQVNDKLLPDVSQVLQFANLELNDILQMAKTIWREMSDENIQMLQDYIKQPSNSSTVQMLSRSPYMSRNFVANFTEKDGNCGATEIRLNILLSSLSYHKEPQTFQALAVTKERQGEIGCSLLSFFKLCNNLVENEEYNNVIGTLFDIGEQKTIEVTAGDTFTQMCYQHFTQIGVLTKVREKQNGEEAIFIPVHLSMVELCASLGILNNQKPSDAKFNIDAISNQERKNAILDFMADILKTKASKRIEACRRFVGIVGGHALNAWSWMLTGSIMEHFEYPLHWAAEKGHINVAERIIAKEAKTDTQQNVAKTTALLDKKKRTPLHCAAENGHVDVANLLLEKDADVEATDAYGRTPLHCAAKNGHVEVVNSLLVKHANVEAKDEQGHTPLHWAASKGHVEVVNSLFEKDAKVEADEDGNTPLHFAAKEGHLEVAKLLAQKVADVNSKNKDNETPHCLASENGHEEVVKLLAK